MQLKPFKTRLVMVMILGMMFVGRQPFGFGAEQGAQNNSRPRTHLSMP